MQYRSVEDISQFGVTVMYPRVLLGDADLASHSYKFL